ncbi:MAG TPA: methyltransferase domain-containing protein [Pirellulales bacterium]|nr:methyltransferase domain-containing protein [Pirellulales bacterium]
MLRLPRRAYEKCILIGKGIWRRTRLAVRRRQVTAALTGKQPPLRLHFGCGANYLDGWVNLDSQRVPRVDIAWDLNDGLPLPDESCRLIYSEHVLEHFPVDRGLALLGECRRVLASDGMLRIAMPSLEHLVGKYVSSDWRDQDWLRLPQFGFIQTRAEMLNIAFRWWGHEWLYDREELHRRLREAGFDAVADLPWGESEIAELRGLETRADSRLICEARKTPPTGR